MLSSSDYQLFSSNQNQNQNPIPGSVTIDTIIYNINQNFTQDQYPFPQTQSQSPQITKEELVIIKKKKAMYILSNIIEKTFQRNPNKMYNLTKYTLFEIDEIKADIYISIDQKTKDNIIPSYYYKIISKNIYEIDDDASEEEEEDKTKDLVIYDNYGFDTIISVLEDIDFVKKNYKILDYYLLSPENMEEAIAQREFIPISQDKICTVCYEPTIEYTTCKHSICLKCREKCIVQGNKLCPICRNSDLCIYPTIELI
jgi:hypothetical protein